MAGSGQRRHQPRIVAAGGEVGHTTARPAPAGPKARDITLTPGSFRADMDELRQRGVTVDLVFGADDLELVSFEALRQGPLGDYLERSRPGIEVAVTERVT